MSHIMAPHERAGASADLTQMANVNSSTVLGPQTLTHAHAQFSFIFVDHTKQCQGLKNEPSEPQNSNLSWVHISLYKSQNTTVTGSPDNQAPETTDSLPQ